MGTAIAALPEAYRLVRSNPILVAGSAIFGVIAVVGAAVSIIPLFGAVLFQVLILPVGLIGLTEMTDSAAENGATSLGKFGHGISNNIKSAIGAYACMLGIQVVAGLLLAIPLAAIIGTAVLNIASEPSGSVLASIGALGVVGVLVVVLVIVVLTIMQNFLDVAVVIGDKDATDAITEAKDILVEAPLSVLGYALVRFTVFTTVLVVPALLAVGVGSVSSDSGGTGAGMIAGGLLLIAGPLAIAFSVAYHVVYYRNRRRDELTPSSSSGVRPQRDDPSRPAGTVE